MGEIRNILFVMYDQLRHDYLSCAGHPTMRTPNFDRLAAMGGAPAGHVLEGRSLVPWLHGDSPDWRDAVFSEYDFSAMATGRVSGAEPAPGAAVHGA